MATTRALVESETVERCRVALARSGMAADPVADASPRAYLNGPLRRALAGLGHSAVDPWAIVDADLGDVDDDDLVDLLDLAELATLETAFNNLDQVDARTLDAATDWSDYPERLASRIAQLRSQLESRPGLDLDGGVSAPEAGVISLGFVERRGCGGEFA
jgi:hypothetical protein